MLGHISCFDGLPQVIALGFQPATGRMVGALDMLDDGVDGLTFTPRS
jgi:fructose 1,6-bisphosphatase